MYNNNNSSFSTLAFNNDLNKIESLLKNGINPIIQDSWGQTPLYHIDNIKKLELLFKYKANPNIQDDSKETVLHHSLQLRNIDKVKLLLKHGADANAQDNFRNTPLKKVIEDHPITSSEKKELIELLLQHGADIKNLTFTQKSNVISTLFNDSEVNTLVSTEAKTLLASEVIEEQSITSKEKKGLIELLLQHGADISHFTLTQKGDIISILCNNTLLSVALKTFLVSEDFKLKQTNHNNIILESTDKIEGKFSIIYDRINKGVSVESQAIPDNLFETELTGDIA